MVRGKARGIGVARVCVQAGGHVQRYDAESRPLGRALPRLVQHGFHVSFQGP